VDSTVNENRGVQTRLFKVVFMSKERFMIRWCIVCLERPQWEILPGGTKTDNGPLASGTLAETCIYRLYRNQNLDKRAAMLRFINRSGSL